MHIAESDHPETGEKFGDGGSYEVLSTKASASTIKATIARLQLVQTAMAKVQASMNKTDRDVSHIRGLVAAELVGSDHQLLMELVNGYGRGEGMAGYMDEYQPLAWNIDVKNVKDFREHWRDVEDSIEGLFEKRAAHLQVDLTDCQRLPSGSVPMLEHLRLGQRAKDPGARSVEVARDHGFAGPALGDFQ